MKRVKGRPLRRQNRRPPRSNRGRPSGAYCVSLGRIMTENRTQCLMRALLALGVYAGGVIDSLLIGGNHDVARFDYGVDLFAGGERQPFSRILRDNRNDFRSSL